MSIPRNLGNFADNVNTNGKVEVTGINATGTPTASTALLGNGTWGTVTTAPAGSTGQVQYNNAGAFGALTDGTSGQVLTSAGAGSAPTWSTPAAGGGTVTMTSSGAITAGLGVIVNSNGTGSIPVLTRTITPLATQSYITGNANANQIVSMIYCTNINAYVAFFSTDTDNYLAAKIGTMTGTGNFIWGDQITLRSGVSQKIQAIWVESLNRFYVSFTDGTNGFVICGSVTNTTITIGSQRSPFTTGGTAPVIAFDETASILIYGSGSDGSGNFKYTTYSTFGNELTQNTAVTSSIVLGSYFLKYWPLAGKVVLFGTLSNQLKAYLITINDTTPSIGSAQSLSSLYYVPKNAAYAFINSNLMLVCADFNSSGINATMVSISGSTITCGSFYNLSGSSNTAQTIGINYAEGVNAYVISYGTTSPYKLNSVMATVSGSVINYGTPTTLISSTSNALTYNNVYNTRLKMIVGYTFINYNGFYCIAQSNGSGTLTSSNFAGIANTSVSTGQSFTATVAGAINTAVSGLITGQSYYLAGDGSLITTPDVPIGSSNAFAVPVGLALSSTSIVMK
jgi:hypothetical protein